MIATNRAPDRIQTVPAVHAKRGALPRGRVTVTFTGLVFVVVATFGALAALNSEANLLLLLVALSSGILIFSIAVPMRIVRGVEVHRHVPAAVTAHTQFSVVYVVHNRRRWGRVWSLGVREIEPARRGCFFAESFVPMLEANHRVELRAPARCDRRGRVQLKGVRIETRFPFGLLRYTIDLSQPEELVVFPALGRLRRPMTGQRFFLQAGVPRSAQPHAGDEEFYGLRDYREGDSLRRIHWRRSARTGELVVRENASLGANQLIVLVDPWPGRLTQGTAGDGRAGLRQWRGRRPPEKLALPEAERIISAAATAVCDGLEHGDRVGLIARAAIPVMIPPAGGRTHRQRLLRNLATIEMGCERSLEELLTGLRWTTGWAGRWLVCASSVTEAHRGVVRYVAGRSRSILLAAPGTEWLEQVFVPPTGSAEKGAV